MTGGYDPKIHSHTHHKFMNLSDDELAVIFKLIRESQRGSRKQLNRLKHVLSHEEKRILSFLDDHASAETDRRRSER